MKISIHHRTSYHYADKVLFGVHQLRMRPREDHGIHLVKSSFKISPTHRLRWIRDLYENNIGFVDFAELTEELVFDCEFVLDVRDRNPFDFVLVPEALEYPFSYNQELITDLQPLSRNIYVRDVDQIREWLAPFWHPGRRVGTLELLQEINASIYLTFRYQRRMEKGVQSPAETLEKNSGSCRDFATFLMEVCRFMGLAARFVSGYMYSPKITGRMSMHGWAEIYLPGAGWIGFDPSWGILADSNYIPSAVSRDSEHVPPISGTYFGTPRSFLRSQVDLYVKRIDEVLPTSASSDNARADQPGITPTSRIPGEVGIKVASQAQTISPTSSHEKPSP